MAELIHTIDGVELTVRPIGAEDRLRLAEHFGGSAPSHAFAAFSTAWRRSERSS